MRQSWAPTLTDEFCFNLDYCTLSGQLPARWGRTSEFERAQAVCGSLHRCGVPVFTDTGWITPRLLSALSLITAMNIVSGSVVWEIGCGVPVLAACMSAVSMRAVLCTDIGQTFSALLIRSDGRMQRRVIERCVGLFAKLSLYDTDDYVDAIAPFLQRADPDLEILLMLLKELDAEQFSTAELGEYVVQPANSDTEQIGSSSSGKEADSTEAAYRVEEDEQDGTSDDEVAANLALQDDSSEDALIRRNGGVRTRSKKARSAPREALQDAALTNVTNTGECDSECSKYGSNDSDASGELSDESSGSGSGSDDCSDGSSNDGDSDVGGMD